MDHHLVLVLAEVLNCVALARVAIKGWNHELLRKFIFQCGHGEGRIGSINGGSIESVVMWHTRFFDSLLYELVEVLNTNECVGSPPRLICSILHDGMSKTWFVVGLFRWRGGQCSATPLTLRLFVIYDSCSTESLWRRGQYWVL